ncbi:heterokaryon incompatibility protein-domain-containing protein, partial [Dendryphion nanum]
MGVESGNLLTAVELYRLLPLKVGNRSIRVLQLSTDQSKPLEGKLKVISLSSYLRSAFVALSYAWGNTDEPHRILCHASTTKSLPAYISITANCCDALMQLRRNQASQWPSSSSIDIWVDAVCINQDAKEGAEEKLTQIPLMQEIYQKAKAVFIWLGTGTQESDLAMEWLTKTSMGRELLSLIKFRAFPANMLPGEIIRLIRIAPELAKGVYHSWAPKRTRKSIDPKHLKDICQREWFSRMWTVQELVMASEPIVICGSKSLRWTPFFWAMVEALEPHSTAHSPLFAKAFNSVVAVTSLWYDLYRKKEFSQPVVRAWANSIQPTLLGTIAHLFLSFLESSFRVILCVGGFSATLVASMGILQGLRPLDNIWILPPLLLMAFTFLLRPGGPREEQKNNFRESLIDVLNLSRSKQATLP